MDGLIDKLEKHRANGQRITFDRTAYPVVVILINGLPLYHVIDRLLVTTWRYAPSEQQTAQYAHVEDELLGKAK